MGRKMAKYGEIRFTHPFNSNAKTSQKQKEFSYFPPNPFLKTSDSRGIIYGFGVHLCLEGLRRICGRGWGNIWLLWARVFVGCHVEVDGGGGGELGDDGTEFLGCCAEFVAGLYEL